MKYESCFETGSALPTWSPASQPDVFIERRLND